MVDQGTTEWLTFVREIEIRKPPERRVAFTRGIKRSGVPRVLSYPTQIIWAAPRPAPAGKADDCQ